MAEFVGNPNIPHVQQPAGSEQCFVAIVAAVTGGEVEPAQTALQAAAIVGEDGSAAPIVGRKVVEVGDKQLTIEPVFGAFDEAEGPEDVIGLIDEQFVAARAVALLYKKTDGPSTYHWTLLTGNFQDDAGETIATEVMDPLRDRKESFVPRRVARMIERSLEDMGVFAYAISSEPVTTAGEPAERLAA